jgi:two-component system capsular synthesis response regulator RcsB
MSEVLQSGLSVEGRAMQDPVRVVVADDHPVILFGAEQALL